MATGQQIATDVLTKLGLCPPSGAPSASDSNYVLSELNTMWDAWGIDEGLIYAVLAAQFPLTAFQQSYSIGLSGADLTATPPSRIYAVHVVDALTLASVTTTSGSATATLASTTGVRVGMGLNGTGIAINATVLSFITDTSILMSIKATASGTVTVTATGLDRNDLEIVDSTRYYSHNDLAATATTPDEIYPDYAPDANGNTRIYIWPTLNGNQAQWVELEGAVAFVAWQLAQNYFIPYGYQDAIEWTVAFRCLSGFGEAISQGVAQTVATEAVKAEQRIRAMNQKNRQLQPQAVMDPATPPQPATAGR